MTAIEVKATSTWQNDFLKGLDFLSGIAKGSVEDRVVIYAGTQERQSRDYELLPFEETAAAVVPDPNKSDN